MDEKEEREHYFVHIWGCVDPQLYGPYATEDKREAALATFKEDEYNEENDSYHLFDAKKGSNVEF